MIELANEVRKVLGKLKEKKIAAVPPRIPLIPLVQLVPLPETTIVDSR